MDFEKYIPWLISLGMFVLAIITLARNGRKDRKADYLQDAQKIDGIKESLIKANMKLDSVCATTNETRSDIKAMGTTIQEFDTRVTIIEENMKTVWLRIDELRTKIEHQEGE